MGKERDGLDRELIELHNELRVVIPGVTVVFAFLLTIPLSSGFADLQGLQQSIYFVAFMATLTAMICLMSPSVMHRLRYRTHERGILLPRWNVIVIVGLSALYVAFGAAAWLGTSFLFSSMVATWVAAGYAAIAGGLWFLAPFLFVNGADESEKQRTPEDDEQDKSSS